jgi:hypothetical protein
VRVNTRPHQAANGKRLTADAPGDIGDHANGAGDNRPVALACFAVLGAADADPAQQ